MEKFTKKEILLAMLRSFTYVTDDDGYRRYSAQSLPDLIKETSNFLNVEGKYYTDDMIRRVSLIASRTNLLNIDNCYAEITELGIAVKTYLIRKTFIDDALRSFD